MTTKENLFMAAFTVLAVLVDIIVLASILRVIQHHRIFAEYPLVWYEGVLLQFFIHIVRGIEAHLFNLICHEMWYFKSLKIIYYFICAKQLNPATKGSAFLHFMNDYVSHTGELLLLRSLSKVLTYPNS